MLNGYCMVNQNSQCGTHVAKAQTRSVIPTVVRERRRKLREEEKNKTPSIRIMYRFEGSWLRIQMKERVKNVVKVQLS